MSPLALGLVLVSVCLHAGWNLLGKRRAPTLVFFALALSSAGLLFSPLLMLGPGPWQLPGVFWGWLLLSGLFQMLYMGGLAWAYARGEISVLYPIARALPVVIVPIISIGLWQQATFYTLDYLAISLIVAGALLLPLAGPQAFRLEHYFTPALAFALLAALATAGYSLVDHQALLIMRGEGYTSLWAGLHFMVLQALVTPLWAIPMVALMPGERRQWRQVWQHARQAALVAGLMITATYGLVLIALALTEHVSLVVAMRQLSIPLGVLLGIVFLKESAAPVKLVGVAIMLAGLVLLAVR